MSTDWSKAGYILVTENNEQVFINQRFITSIIAKRGESAGCLIRVYDPIGECFHVKESVVEIMAMISNMTS